jgi:hypothetical protein
MVGANNRVAASLVLKWPSAANAVIAVTGAAIEEIAETEAALAATAEVVIVALVATAASSASSQRSILLLPPYGVRLGRGRNA